MNSLKLIIIITFIMVMSHNVFCQNVGISDIGDFTPDSSSVLELQSISKGFLLPRMDYTQRTSIPAPAHGLMVIQNGPGGLGPGIYYYSTIDNQWHLLQSFGTGFGFNLITTGTNTQATMTVSSGASLLLDGTGIIQANQFIGSGSTTTAVDLGTAEVAGILPIAKGGTNSGTALVNNRIMVSSGGQIVEGLPGTSGQILQSNGDGVAPTWVTLASVLGFAAPTALVGLTPIPGTATTAMRSDAAPAIDQSITPTWTGMHTFSKTGTAITLSGTGSRIDFTGPASSTITTAQFQNLSILPGGNLGIGTLTPQQKLDVSGNLQFSGALMPGGNQGSSGQFLQSLGGGTPIWVTIQTFGGYAAPPANSVTLGPVVEGVATTSLRSDVTLQLSQAIVPTWTGVHTFNAAGDAIRLNNGPQNIYFMGGAAQIKTATNFNLSLMPNGTGNVGINEAAPTQKLTIKGNVLVESNTGVASELHFATPDNSFYTSFKAQTQPSLSNINYTLPPSQGTIGTFLQNDGTGNLTWGIPPNTGVGGSGSATQVAFWTAPTTLSGNNNLWWDNVNGRLGVGNSIPTERVDITGNLKFSGALMPNNQPGSAFQILQSNGPALPPTWVTLSSVLGFATPPANSVTLGPPAEGIATTALRSDATLQLSQAIVPTWTGVHTFNAPGSAIVLNNGPQNIAFMGAGQAQITTNNQNLSLMTGTGNVGIGVAAPTQKLDVNGSIQFSGAIMPGGNPGVSGQILQSTGAGTTPTWVTISSVLGFADPTAMVGLTAVNGSATTAMRSDAAPPIDQGIAPTWTNLHTFSKTDTVIKLSGAAARIAFTGTGTAKISTAANNSLVLMPGGTGNIGINESAPSQKLSIKGNVLLEADTTAVSELRMATPNNTYYSAFKTQTQTENITYTLPASQTATGVSSTSKVLIDNNSSPSLGTLSWATSQGFGGTYVNTTKTTSTSYSVLSSDYLIVASDPTVSVVLPKAGDFAGKVYYIVLDYGKLVNTTVYTSFSAPTDRIVNNSRSLTSVILDRDQSSNSTINGIMLVSDGIITWYVVTVRKNF